MPWRGKKLSEVAKELGDACRVARAQVPAKTTARQSAVCLQRRPPSVLRNVAAHHLKGVANATPELSNVGGCLAERVLQTI